MLRRIALLQSTRSSLPLGELLEKHGWILRKSADVESLISQRAAEECDVGIIVFERVDDFDQADISSLLAGGAMEWILVVTRSVLREPFIARLIVTAVFDFHTLPIDEERLLAVLGHAMGKANIRRSLATDDVSGTGRYGMIGRSTPMLALYRAIDRIVQVEAPVLISGESGTGKELVARAIHDHSARPHGPFIAVNCGALPTSLVQSELFGHERGSFTGAHQRKIGSIEAASGGTVFLDEVGDLPLESQASLLRFLQEKTIVRVGSTRPVSVDARVVAATHIDLLQAVRQKRFREDLFYRLNVLHVSMPPLRERGSDIRLLADAVFQMHSGEKAPSVRGFSEASRQAMDLHDWPGNVRELMNRVHKAMIMCEGRQIEPSDLGLTERTVRRTPVSLESARHVTERELILSTLERNRHNMAATARQLGVSRVTLYRLIHKLAIGRAAEARVAVGSVGREGENRN